MTNYLLVVSLILHFITFLILILVVKKMRTMLDYERLETQKRELEDLLAFYAVELKEENERFLEQVLEANETKDRHLDQIEEKQLQEEKPKVEKVMATESVSHRPAVEKEYEPSLEARALQLHEQGYEIKEIAKKLNKGHGEIELLLKFHHSS